MLFNVESCRTDLLSMTNHIDHPWHTVAPDEALRSFEVTPDGGLSTHAAAAELARIGENALPESRRRSVLQMFASQFKDFMITVLLAAALVSVAQPRYAPRKKVRP